MNLISYTDLCTVVFVVVVVVFFVVVVVVLACHNHLMNKMSANILL